MKTLGMVGGTGWISTVEYYRLINEAVQRRLGGLHSAKCVLCSLDYEEFSERNERGDLRGVYEIVSSAARTVADAGAEGLLLCANTMHLYADELEKEIPIPIVHIADATAARIVERRLSKVGLLGTRQTMEEEFYFERLKRKGVDAVAPEKEDREFIHGAIMDEFLKGIFRDETRARFVEIAEGLRGRGAAGVVMGCTEIPLLLRNEDIDTPLFHTTEIHATAAVDFMLG